MLFEEPLLSAAEGLPQLPAEGILVGRRVGAEPKGAAVRRTVGSTWPTVAGLDLELPAVSALDQAWRQLRALARDGQPAPFACLWTRLHPSVDIVGALRRGLTLMPSAA